MKHIFVRPSRPADAGLFIKWSQETKNNLFDPAPGLAPTSFTTCAFNEDRIILFAPVQVPLFMEALAINPEASELEKAAALKAVTQFLVSQAYIQGRAEVYFFCADESTVEFAKRQAFEEVPFRLFRIRTSMLEPKES